MAPAKKFDWETWSKTPNSRDPLKSTPVGPLMPFCAYGLVSVYSL